VANGGIALLTADAADLALGTILTPQWGIYLNGAPVILPASIFSQQVFGSLSAVAGIASAAIALVAPSLGAPNLLPSTASTVDFEFAAESPLSDYTQEQGAFQSYDKVTLPFDIKIKLKCSGNAQVRQAFLSTCQWIRNSLNLFDIVTPEQKFRSVNCHHVDWRRTAASGVSMIVVDLWFQQIAVTSSSTFSSTQNPAEAGQQSLGNVQAQPPGQSVTSQFGSGIKVQ